MNPASGEREPSRALSITKEDSWIRFGLSQSRKGQLVKHRLAVGRLVGGSQQPCQVHGHGVLPPHSMDKDSPKVIVLKEQRPPVLKDQDPPKTYHLKSMQNRLMLKC